MENLILVIHGYSAGHMIHYWIDQFNRYSNVGNTTTQVTTLLESIDVHNCISKKLSLVINSKLNSYMGQY